MNLSRSPGIAFPASLLFALTPLAPAQDPAGAKDLSDPLTMADGRKVTTAAQWRDLRRPELLELFTREMYGQMPSRPAKMAFLVFDSGSDALAGKATRKQVTVLFGGNPDGPKMDLLIYFPKNAKAPVPAILGINFWGNHTITTDPGVRITSSWVESRKNPYIDLSCVKDGHATGACRGINARQWPLETILGHGYAVATFYRGDIDPDTKDGFANSIRAAFPELQNRRDNFSTIAAWAWALSRAMDYLVTDHDIDAKHVAAFGWSRLGKAALWAGANDERLAAVVSNESGAGGAKLFHRGVGESVAALNRVFPHWYCENFRKYNDRDTALPFDQHEVIALIAPRPVYIASAEGDREADPEGEFASARAAGPVYRLLGKQGLGTDHWPAVNQPVIGDIAYHVRSGVHDVTDFDWTQYLRFFDKHWKGSML